jgi:hypothetical protein
MYICIYVCMYVCIYVCIYIYIYMYVYIYIYIVVLRHDKMLDLATYADVCRTYADVCRRRWRMLTYAGGGVEAWHDAIAYVSIRQHTSQPPAYVSIQHVCRRRCWDITRCHVGIASADVCWRMLTYAGGGVETWLDATDIEILLALLNAMTGFTYYIKQRGLKLLVCEAFRYSCIRPAC